MRRLIIISLPLLVCFAMCAKPTPREMRIPLFIIGLILFWVAAALRYRSGRRGAEIDEHYLSIPLSGN